MKKSEFLALINTTFEEMQALTATKGEEYAASDDQLANFKRSAKQAGIGVRQAWLVFFNKHMDAIRSYIYNVSRSKHGYAPSEPIEGRIDDAILYLLLLKAIIQERDGLQKQPDFTANFSVGTRPEARGQERELHTGHESGDQRRRVVDRSEILQKVADQFDSDPSLHYRTKGLADSEGEERGGKGVPVGRTSGLRPVDPPLPTDSAARLTVVDGQEVWTHVRGFDRRRPLHR